MKLFAYANNPSPGNQGGKLSEINTSTGCAVGNGLRPAKLIGTIL